jgi:2-dehydro-3-deoxygalactonokinase
VSDEAILVDLGTTNCRVWLAKGTDVLARANAQVGVRDTARDGSSQRLRESLRSLIETVCSRSSAKPSVVIAAGMITSSLGLAEVPHVVAPAGVDELAAGTQAFEFSDIAPLPFLLVPGVRTGTLSGELKDVGQADVMRGEETFCAGLVACGLISGRATVISLGSHWKAIPMDDRGRVLRSLTCLSGELILAVQTNTILASAVPQDRPSSLDQEWVDAGMRKQRGSGLSRAMFCVRLLELAGKGTPQQRYAYLAGAFIAENLDLLLSRQFLSPEVPVLVSGATGLGKAWCEALAGVLVRAIALSDAQVEQSLIAGLNAIREAV